MINDRFFEIKNGKLVNPQSVAIVDDVVLKD